MGKRQSENLEINAIGQQQNGCIWMHWMVGNTKLYVEQRFH